MMLTSWLKPWIHSTVACSVSCACFSDSIYKSRVMVPYAVSYGHLQIYYAINESLCNTPSLCPSQLALYVAAAVIKATSYFSNC